MRQAFQVQKYYISIHALREEGDWGKVDFASIFVNFYPRPPRGGRRCCKPSLREPAEISIHALREEGDRKKGVIIRTLKAFLSTPSARRATRVSSTITKQERGFLSTPSARRATWRNSTKRPACSNFYPRPPRGGRRRGQQAQGITKVFLSTPSARRATTTRKKCFGYKLNFYPRPPRGGRLCHAWSHGVAIGISIHALREEGDSSRQQRCRRDRISIHALREEGDLYCAFN